MPHPKSADASNSLTHISPFPALTGGRLTCDGPVPVYKPTQAGHP
nr:MAG TPA: hypothetical protein [Caudoviricetes sp.]